MHLDEFPLISLEKEDLQAAVRLVSLAMNDDEAAWAEKTLTRHFQCRQHRIADGRDYLILKDGDAVIGLVGLHHYVWGPPDNVWLAWFAVHPDAQGHGLGAKLLMAAETMAVNRGYGKLLVETYHHPDFKAARSLYRKMGFRKVGAIEDYLSDGSTMLVYGKALPS